MPAYGEHAITRASFAQIDREIGAHGFPVDQYSVVRRVIHTTADFDFKDLIRFSGEPLAAARKAFLQGAQIVTDVSMVAAGIRSVVAKTWQLPVTVAVQHATQCPSGETLSAYGMGRCACQHPGGIFVIGNAPTALLTLCEGISRGDWQPSLVIGVPVGFINVVESKQALAELAVPHILVSGRKGGSAVAAAILNALMIGAWEKLP